MSFLDDMTKLCNNIMDEAKKEAESRLNAESDLDKDEDMDAEEILLDTMRRLNKFIADNIEKMDPMDASSLSDSIAKLYTAYINRYCG